MVRAELLETVGFDFIDIQEFYSEIKPNKHGKAIIGGTIRGDKKEEYLSSGGKVTQIIAKTYAKARMEGDATPDTTLKDRNVMKQKLG